MDDTSLFPFDKHKGKPMQDIPVEYLHWVWHNASGTHTTEVRDYIKKSMNSLRMEKPDLIWDLTKNK
jgi:hypothetical protein